jgi:hypothetical protein
MGIIQSYLKLDLQNTYRLKDQLKTFMNSNFSLIKFNVSTTRGSSNIKPITTPNVYFVEHWVQHTQCKKWDRCDRAGN